MKTTGSIKDNDFGMGNVMTIDLFNKLTRLETLHPLVAYAIRYLFGVQPTTFLNNRVKCWGY